MLAIPTSSLAGDGLSLALLSSFLVVCTPFQLNSELIPYMLGSFTCNPNREKIDVVSANLDPASAPAGSPLDRPPRFFLASPESSGC